MTPQQQKQPPPLTRRQYLKDKASLEWDMFKLRVRDCRPTRYLADLGDRLRTSFKRKTGVTSTYSKAAKKAKPGESPKVTQEIQVTDKLKKGLGTMMGAMMGDDRSVDDAASGESSRKKGAADVGKGAAKTAVMSFFSLKGIATIAGLGALIIIVPIATVALIALTTWNLIKLGGKVLQHGYHALTTTPEKRRTAQLLFGDNEKTPEAGPGKSTQSHYHRDKLAVKEVTEASQQKKTPMPPF